MQPTYSEYRYASGEPLCPHDYLIPVVVQMLGPPRGAILDLGCGNGAFARTLIRRGYDVYGIDASASGIAMASREHPDRFFVANLDDGRVPEALRDKRIVTVVSTEVIEHLYSPRRLLNFARNAMRGQGELVVSTPYHGYLKNVALAVSGRLDAHFTANWDGGHIKFFSRRTLESLLEDEGFTVIDYSGAGRFPLFWKSMVIRART